ncbi:MAG TPA: tetratricopeptide repeat protein [Candidatus Acidoferrales bacterium]|nr:tetratricopeptide repeat protein [Candidatus Acidoferrales bacterium]
MPSLMIPKRGDAAVALGAVLCLALIAALPAAAQGTPPKQSTQQQQPQQAGQAQPQGNAQNPTASQQPPVTKEEEDAYKAFNSLPAEPSAPIISQGQEFLSKYPKSIFRPVIFARLTLTFLNARQVDQMFSTADKALVEDPDNLDVLALMSTTIPVAGYDPRALDADQKLLLAEKYAKRVIELAPKMTKPLNMTDEDFAKSINVKLGMAHSGLGRVYFRQGKTSDSVNELGQSVKADPSPDALDYYLLGDGQMRLKDYPDAFAAFESCGKSPWAWQDRCKQLAQDAKKLAAAPPAAKP